MPGQWHTSASCRRTIPLAASYRRIPPAPLPAACLWQSALAPALSFLENAVLMQAGYFHPLSSTGTNRNPGIQRRAPDWLLPPFYLRLTILRTWVLKGRPAGAKVCFFRTRIVPEYRQILPPAPLYLYPLKLISRCLHTKKTIDLF